MQVREKVVSDPSMLLVGDDDARAGAGGSAGDAGDASDEAADLEA